MLGVLVEFAEQAAVIDQAAGQDAAVDAQFGGLYCTNDKEQGKDGSLGLIFGLGAICATKKAARRPPVIE